MRKFYSFEQITSLALPHFLLIIGRKLRGKTVLRRSVKSPTEMLYIESALGYELTSQPRCIFSFSSSRCINSSSFAVSVDENLKTDAAKNWKIRDSSLPRLRVPVIFRHRPTNTVFARRRTRNKVRETRQQCCSGGSRKNTHDNLFIA